jgi:PAS domain-containing protein
MIKTATTTPTKPDELSDQQACVFRSLPAMVYTYSVNHDTGKNNFPFVSDYCEEIFGLPASTIVNESESFVNLVHPDDVNAFAASVLHSMQTMTIWDHKMRMHNVNSEMVYIHGKSVPHREDILNADGSFTKLTVWHGVLFDITNRYDEECKNAREKTNDNNNDNNTGGSNGYSKIMRTKILRDDFSTKYAPSFDIDIDGNIEYWNDQMVTLVGGVLSSDVMGQNLRSLVSDSNQGQAETFLATAASKCIDSSPHEEYGDHIYDEKYMTNLTLKSKIGGEVHLIITCYPRNDPPGLSCICEDITLIKVAEKEKKVALQLLDAEKTLSEWLSHEIRNPLTIAMEAAKSLKEMKSNRHNNPFGTESDAFKLGNSSTNIDFDEDSFSYVDLIIQSISYVVDLLSNILDLNKLAAGKIVLRPSKCSLKADIIQPIQEMMSVKNNNVPILFTGEDMNISIDSLRLKQVMTNLLSNAIKFTKKGFIKIHSERTQHGVDGREITESLVISVSDTGPGVPEKHRKLLFTKFEQLGSNVNGTGIGLCLSRFLVMAMEGEILLNEHYDSGIPGSPGAQVSLKFSVNKYICIFFLCSKLISFLCSY